MMTTFTALFTAYVLINSQARIMGISIKQNTQEMKLKKWNGHKLYRMKYDSQSDTCHKSEMLIVK